MQTSKNWFGLVGAAIPVLICGGLLLYFHTVRGALDGLGGDQLGPTMFGVGAFGLLFLVLFLVKLWRIAGGAPASPAARAEAAVEAERSDFDADAAFARYIARRGDTPPATRPPGSFGRKPD